MPPSVMPIAATSIQRPPQLLVDRPSYFVVWAILLLLGMRFYVTVESFWFGIGLPYLLPLFAVWWAERDGLRAIVPLASLSLMPNIGFRTEFMSVTFGYTPTVSLLAVGLAIAVAPQDAATRLAPRAWLRWRWVGLAALLLWIACAVLRFRVEITGVDLSNIAIDPMAVLAMLASLVAIDVRRLAASLEMPRVRIVVLGTLMMLCLSCYVSLRLFTHTPFWLSGDLSIRIGSASASFLLPAAIFVAVLCGWTTWWRAVLLIGVLALVEQVSLLTVVPPSSWILVMSERIELLKSLLAPEPPFRWMLSIRPPEPLILLTEACISAMMGIVFVRERATATSLPVSGIRPLRAVTLVLIGTLVVLPILTNGSVPTSGVTLWAHAGLAFLGGRHLRERGAVGVPLALLGAMAALSVGIDPLQNRSALRSSLPELAGITFVYGLAGTFSRRRSNKVQLDGCLKSAPEAIDVSVVANIVQQLDHAATNRAFAALLLPAIVLGDLIGPGGMVRINHLGLADDPIEIFGWIAPVMVAASVVLLPPLSIVVLDWLNRQDRFRVLSALTCGVLVWIGVAIPTLGIGALLSILPDKPPTATRVGIAALLATEVAASCCWLRSSHGGMWRKAAWVFSLLFALGVAAMFVSLIVMLANEGVDSKIWLQLVVFLIGLVMLGVSWVRSVRLHFFLAEEHPRTLLFGALPAGRFWARIGALLGLPSSMWSTSVFRRPAAWCILLARPLVFVGVALLDLSTPLSIVVIVAGIAVFVVGKRLAALQLWRLDGDAADARAPVLFLRSFEDDQFDFHRAAWQLRLHWYDLWSFRRNLDEAMVDEVALFGPVVALGRPNDKRAPFGASRHWASHETWQEVVTQTARRARAIVLAAGESPGLRWEFDLLRREQLVDRTVLLLHPDRTRADSNRRALIWLLGNEAQVDRLLASGPGLPVALWHAADGPHLLRVTEPSAAAYLVALRAHFQQLAPQAVGSSLT